MDDSAEAYEANAIEFLCRRDESTIGSNTVAQWSGTLRKAASVIELACGGGFPVTRVLDSFDLQLWAVDSSPTLVATFQSRFPQIPIQCERVQDFDFFNRKFDAALAIGLVFLLPKTEQIKLISRVSEVLNNNGRFLFTAPIQTGKWTDLNTGMECHSLGQNSYEEILSSAGFRVVSTFVDKGENNYYDVERVKA
jgi:cyclopropane fatty-acyl-phospholipid synthase-like methyltransferase